MEQRFKKQKLSEYIINYLEVLHDCLNNTNFADDRSGFKASIVIVSFWLVELKYKSFDEMVETITDSQTDKSILDSWKSGEWGEKEANELKILRDKIKTHLLKG